MHDAQWLYGFRRCLLAWYSNHKRDLPWRHTRDPYAIWVSEIMLQQTQVAAVIDYYHRFLNRFPSVGELAQADEQEVLALWSGLGYYRRARQMHTAAKTIVEDYGGVFPQQMEQVLALPGVGRYTAGAITSFAFGARNPILEANTLRLFSRLLALREDNTVAKSQAQLWQFAQAMLPRTGKSAGELNQAAMELGNLVCTPTLPDCPACPVAKLCPTKRLGLQATIPVPKAKKQFEQTTHALVLVRKRNSYLMRRNEVGNWWEGLWDFPRTRLSPHTADAAHHAGKDRDPVGFHQQLESEFSSSLGLDCEIATRFHTMRHSVTRFKIQLLCFEASVDQGTRLSDLRGDWMWVPKQRLASLAITSTARKLHLWLDNPRH